MRILLLAVAVFFCFISGADSITAQTTDDHGNTLSDATNLPLGSSIAGRIDPGNDLDVFKLDLSGASGYTNFWIYTTGALDTLGRLYDSNIELLASNDNPRAGETNFQLPWTLPPGVYYIAVYSADGTTTGDYTLHAKADDHGDYFSVATTLSLRSPAAGRIDPGFDQDVFKLDLSGASGTTDVWIYTTGDLDTRGWLYDSSGDLLVFNGDSYIAGRETGFSLRSNLPRGVYYISVRSWLTADGDYATGDYTLHAEAVTDPGSATGTAATLSLDSPTPGMIDTANDADYFRLVLAESKNLVIYTKGLDLSDSDRLFPIFPLDSAVLDNNGTEISVNVYTEETSGERWGFRIEDDFGPGTYYVKVTAPASDTTYPVPYTIHAYEDTDYTNFINDCEAATVALNAPPISDSLYGCQWHLQNQEPGGEDINVEPVWAEGINGEGVNIVVVDDGMYHTHEDLAVNVNTSLNHNYDTSNRDSHDIYEPYEHHGTAVAGVIAARDNGVGVRGVAPRATVYGYNWLAGDWQQFEDINRADAMSRNRVVTAVSNNSWGPTDGPWLGYANQLWELAVDSGTREGYDGKGVFYAWAGGNGGGSHLENPDGTPVGGHFVNLRDREDNSNYDELANYHAVTAVCAVNDQDTRSVYSEKGANLWVCAPSSGDSDQGHRGIVTTENSDRYQDDFGGTSAAAPIVSGVAALLRQANPDLTWRDLKLILAASARKNDAANPGWAEGARKYGADSDTDRYHFNHEYGFGVVDAKAAVDLAQGWTNVPTLESASAASQAAVTIPPPSGSAPQTVTTTLTLNTGIRFTEFVEINTDFDHTSFRDMEIEVVSPSGAVSKLAVPFNTRHYEDTYVLPDGTTFDGTYFVPLDGEFRFGSARHLGEDPNGVWTLRLTDHFPVLGGTLRSWSIKVYGHVSRPGAPTITAPITAGDDSLTVDWSAPSDSGGPAITAYDLRYIQTSADETVDNNWTVVQDVWTGSGPLQYVLTGLADGTQYDVQVRAINSDGDGPWSAMVTGTTAGTVAAAPMGLTATANGQTRIDLSWRAPSDDGGAAVTGYRIEVSEDNSNWSDLVTNTNSTGTSYSHTGLDAGSTRHYRVSAINSAGTGTASDPESATTDTQQDTSACASDGAVPDAANNPGLVADCEALLDAEDTLRGAAGLNWAADTPISQWDGITVGGTPRRVTRLDTSGAGLTGTIPPELGNLTSLTNLRLSNNKLTGQIPSSLGSLANLQGLYLSSNQLTGQIPAELGSLTKLEVLHLYDNQLTGEIPPELGSLATLERLRLFNNQLTGPIPTWLGNLANLEVLSLRENQLTGEIPAELGSLSNLTNLNLSRNQLTGEIPAELGSLTNLVHLVLSGNQLTGEIPGELGGLTNLQTLWLSGNQLTGCIPNGLRGIETNDLSQLGLPFCDMPGAPTIATPIVPGDASLTVAWAAPINTGSSAITAYDLRYIETGAADKSDANWTVVEDVWAAGSGSLQYTLSGLTGGTQYDVQVRAVSAVGASAWSAAVTGTTASAGTAGDPLVVRYDANGNGMIEKNEVIAAINDYLFGGGEPITKADVIKLINLYLFG